MAATKFAITPMKVARISKPGGDLEKAAEGYARMMSREAQFRVVLTM